MSKRYSRIKSFKFAFSGIKEAIKNEPNFMVQVAIGAIAVLMAVYFKLSHIEWLVLLLTIALVLILELINTSLEAIVDLVSPEIKERAKVAKDVAAAAVLLSSISSVVVGGFLFLPKIIAFFF